MGVCTRGLQAEPVSADLIGVWRQKRFTLWKRRELLSGPSELPGLDGVVEGELGRSSGRWGEGGRSPAELELIERQLGASESF